MFCFSTETEMKKERSQSKTTARSVDNSGGNGRIIHHLFFMKSKIELSLEIEYFSTNKSTIKKIMNQIINYNLLLI